MPEGPADKNGLEGKETDLSPIARALTRISSWFSAGKPQPPADPRQDSLLWNFPLGANIMPQVSTGSIYEYSQLRNLADNCPLLRQAIERRKYQIAKLKWTIAPKVDESLAVNERPPASIEAKIAAAEARRIFTKPDGRLSFQQWLKVALEDVFVIDALAIEPRFNEAGGIYGYDVIDGATIKRIIDDTGRQPAPPEVAYQQVVNGRVVCNLPADGLLYYQDTPRSNRLYGYSKVEQIATIVNIALRRDMARLHHYTAGSMPDTIMEAPPKWGRADIQAYQVYWDDMLSGKSKALRRTRWVPAGSKPHFTKQDLLADQFDEFLARVICWTFDLPPNALVQMMNRATAQSQVEEAKQEGLVPVMESCKNIMDSLIAFNPVWRGIIEFLWREESSPDPREKIETDNMLIEKGVRSIDGIRAEYGEPPLGLPPMLWVNGIPYTADQIKAGDHIPAAAPAGGLFMARKGGKLAKAKKGRRLMRRPTNPVIAQAMITWQGILGKFLASVGPGIADAIAAGYEQPGEAEAKARKIIKAQALRKADLPSDLDKLLDELDLAGWAALIESAEKELGATAKAANAAIFAQLGIDNENILSIADDKAVTYARNRAAELVGMTYDSAGNLVVNPNANMAITEATRENLRTLVGNALDEGMTRDQLKNAILNSENFSASRAKKIAQTELSFANSNATKEAWLESGVVRGKVWLLSDNHPSFVAEYGEDVCDWNAAEGEIPLNQSFSSGQDMNPAHPGCECDVSATVD